MIEEWSLKVIQDLVIEREEWEKKTLYATDSDKCACGVYYALKGEKSPTGDDPRGLRRMEVGTMIEYNQVKKLKFMGILIEAQRRIADEDHKVSGRHDGIIISPIQCSTRAKDLIERKKSIFKEIETIDKNGYKILAEYQKGELSKADLLAQQIEALSLKQDLYDEDWHINQELLVPNPENSLMVLEFKSITEAGWKFRKKEGAPSDSHKKQMMFYLWKLRQIYPEIKARVIYVDTSYQEILEFDIDLDVEVIEDLKKFWSYINECVATSTPPEPAPSIVKDSRSGKWKVNYQAEWCKYHQLCTKNPNWLGESIKKVTELNKKK